MVVEVPKIQLGNGQTMPIVGLGTYARKAEPGQYRQAVEWAIEAGYRHIDTASSYHNEEEVGQGIANAISKGLVTRQELFVTTKLWNDCHTEADVIPALEKSLAKLKLDYVDLYLVHWPVSVNASGEDMGIDYLETWRGMEEAVRRGLARGIGVSNFNADQLQRLIRVTQIKPLVNQIEVNPTLTNHELVNFCKANGVVPIAYTALGLLSEARPEFADKDVIKTDAALGRVAEQHGKTRAQVVLRYLIQRSIPVIPKSFTQSRLAENLNIFDFELSPADMDVVDSYNINHRCVPATGFAKLKNYPF
ncbi:aldo-keto reductase AKR2E4-like [Cydia splendana]|uniref:aldo-keto reductase AKR2E4-like n=1 Tax=Cydia splendana TaxID=1100963 RepID=UPI002141BFCE